MLSNKLKIIHVIPYHSSPSSFIFAKRQVEDLADRGHENQIFFFSTSFSIRGFKTQLKKLKDLVNETKPDVIHAHYGTITSYFASCIKNLPLVVTFQGSDLNFTSDIHWLREKLGKQLSKISAQRAQQIICVSESLQANLLTGREKSHCIPSGINTRVFQQMDRDSCKNKLGLSQEINYVFFNANNPIVKRFDIAQEVVSQLHDLNVQLLSLDGEVTPNDIPLYLNASVATLLCSDSEGSPMVIKESMACGLPIVSVDVGDVKMRIEKVENCFIVAQNANLIAEKIRYLIENNIVHTNGLEVLKQQEIDYLSVVIKVENIYKQAINLFNK